MASARSQASSGWAVLVTLVVPAIVIEYVLFVVALGQWSRSCSDAENRAVMAVALGIVPLLYFLIDRRATRERLWRVIARTLAITVVSLLPVAVAYPGLENAPSESKRRDTMKRMEQIAKRLEDYASDHARYPDASSVSAIGSDLPQMDAWCRPFVVASSATHYSIVSYGRDGRPGGGDAYHRYDEDLVYADGAFRRLRF